MHENRSRSPRLVRALILLTATLLTMAALASSALASTHHSSARKTAKASKRALSHKKAHAASALPAEGIFDSCGLSATLSTCEQDLVRMHQAGLQVAVTSVHGDSLADIAAYAAYAQSIGMSIMWEINDPGFWGGTWIGSSAAADWSGFSTACGCTSTTQVLDYMIKWLAALPATYGYYAADDWTLTRNQLPGLKQYVNEIKASDSSHMVMVGSTQAQGGTYYQSGATIGNELYPETSHPLMPAGQNLAAWQSVQDSVTQDVRDATNAGTSSAFILQAFTFGDNLDDGEAVGVCTPNMTQAHCASLLHYPSASVQLQLRNEVLQHADPKLILWYTYGQASQGNRWADLSSVVRTPYPATATAARTKQGKSRKASTRRGRSLHQKHGRKLSV